MKRALFQRRRLLGLALFSATGSALGIKHYQARQARLREQERVAAEAAAEEAHCTAEALAHQRQEQLERELRSQLSLKARAVLEGASLADESLLETERQHVLSVLRPLEARALAQVPAIAEHLGSFSEVARIILLLARDQVLGSHDTADRLERRLAPLSTILLAMNAEAEASLQRRWHGLQAHSQQVASTLLAEIDTLGAASTLPGLAESLTPALCGLQDAQLKLGLALVTAPLEIFSAVALAGWLAKVLNRFVQRAVSVGAANLALAVGDGPLPFGDVIALLVDAGFLVWTAWDIYSLSHELPGRLREELRRWVNTHRDRLLTAVARQSQAQQEQTHQDRLNAVAPLLPPPL